MKLALRAAGTTAVWLYRRTGGRIGGTAKGTQVLLLTVVGRKTGRPFTVPVSYFRHGSDYLVTGSAGGMKHDPQWIRNLKAAGQAEIEIGRERVAVDGRVTSGAERDELWRGVVLAQAPFFTEYEQKSGRVIPVATLVPRP
jgi:deazaflavin-dependent oxidoreductase (nitroreductase family)